MKPIFSVITVTYNAEEFVERTVRSVLSQTYLDIEYLIIDGASKDKTMEIVKRYDNVRMKCVSEPDNGLYDAMNKGLVKAIGDYVLFLNAGDEFASPTVLSDIVEGIGEEVLPDIIYGETMITNTAGEIVAARRLKTPETLDWRSFKMGMLVCHQSFIVKRSIAMPYNLSYRLSADFDWCIACMKRAEILHNTHLVISHFLEAGMSTTSRKKSLRERYAIMCHYYGTIPTAIRHLWFALRFFWAKLFVGRV